MSMSNFSLTIFPIIYGALISDNGASHPEGGLMFVFGVLFLGTLCSVFLYVVDLEGNSILDRKEGSLAKYDSGYEERFKSWQKYAVENTGNYKKLLEEPI